MVAAECCGFIDDGALDTERWEPYRDWISKLGQTDYIITFNYDLVLEKLGRGKIITSSDDAGRFDRLEVPKILKLHGSVDWQREGNGSSFSKSGDDFHALRCAPDAMAIATPGPSKKAMASNLRVLWDMACTVLRKADHIIFIGYRFPPTDAQARSVLLRAISENDRPARYAHVVLGPDLGSPDSRRLKQMLEYSMTRKPLGQEVIQHPLWAEDYLSLINPP
jgi:hypothetical protein